jgi:hypothetical protein
MLPVSHHYGHFGAEASRHLSFNLGYLLQNILINSIYGTHLVSFIFILIQLVDKVSVWDSCLHIRIIWEAFKI